MKFNLDSSHYSIIKILFLFLTIESITYSQTPAWLDLDTVKAGKFDTGKMWTFEYPPTKYFKEEYNFSPDE